MKLLLSLALLLSFQSAFATNFLTEDQESETLTQIDNICGDTWCEGDYDYSFNELKCDSETNTCELTFEFILYVHDEEGAHPSYDIIGEQRAEVTCTLAGVSSYEQMVDTSLRYGGLIHEFYETVGECIDENYDQAPGFY